MLLGSSRKRLFTNDEKQSPAIAEAAASAPNRHDRPITAAGNPRGRAVASPICFPEKPHVARLLKNHRPAHWRDLAADWLEIAKRYRLEAIKAACAWRDWRNQRLCRMASFSVRPSQRRIVRHR